MSKLLPKIIADELDESCEVVKGKRHWHILVSGRLAAIFPKGGATEGSQRANLNVRADIRRAKQGLYGRAGRVPMPLDTAQEAHRPR